MSWAEVKGHSIYLLKPIRFVHILSIYESTFWSKEQKQSNLSSLEMLKYMCETICPLLWIPSRWLSEHAQCGKWTGSIPYGCHREEAILQSSLQHVCTSARGGHVTQPKVTKWAISHFLTFLTGTEITKILYNLCNSNVVILYIGSSLFMFSLVLLVSE